MATRLFAPQVTPTAAPMPASNFTPPAAAFGGGTQGGEQLAQGFGQLADAAMKIGLAEKAKDDEAALVAADTADSEWYRQQRTDPNGFYAKQGMDAWNGLGDYEQAARERIQQTAASLGDETQRRAYNKAASARLEMMLGRAGDYAIGQREKARDETDLAAQGNAIQDGAGSWNRPGDMDRFYGLGRSAVMAQANRRGWSVDVTEAALRKYDGDFYAGAIRQAAVDDPTAAQGLLDQYGPKLGAAYPAIKSYVQPLADRAIARQAADATKQSLTGSTADMVSQAAQAAGVDQTLALTTASIESGMGLAPGARSLGQVKPGTAAQVGQPAGGDTATQAQTMAKVLQHSQSVAATALGQQPEPWQTYLTYQQGDGGGPALLKADPNASAVDTLAPLYDTRAKAAQAIAGNGGSPDMTVGQFLDHWQQGYQQRAARVAKGLPTLAADTGAGSPRDQATQAEGALPGRLARLDLAGLSQEQHDLAVGMVVSDVSQKETAANAAHAATGNQLARLLVNNNLTSPDQIPPDLWAATAAEPDLRAGALERMKANAAGKPIQEAPENVEEYQRLLGMSLTDPQGFSKLHIAQWMTPGKNEDGSPRPALTTGQVNSLLGRWDQVSRPDAQAQPKLNFLNQALGNADVQTTLDQTGISKKTNPKAYDQFVGAFSTAVDSYRSSHDGKDPQAADLKGITIDLLRKATVTGSLWDSTRRVYALGSGGDDPGARSSVAPIGADPQKGQVAYAIDPADRSGITQAYQSANSGRTPTEAEIQAIYHARMVKKGYVR